LGRPRAPSTTGGDEVLEVLACGLPVPGDRVDAGVRQLELGDGPPDGPAVLDAVAAPVRAGATLLAVVPRWDLEPTLHHLQVARSALDVPRLAIHRTSLPPLAAGALALVLAELVHRELLSDAVVLGRAADVERHVVGAAWLGSVARLREPAPRLSHHARSYLPGTAFGAVIDDEPRVEPLRRGDAAQLDLPSTAVAGGWRAYVAAGADGDREAVRRSLARRARGAPIEEVAITERSTGWWGTSKLVELALVPADLAALAAQLASEGAGPTTCRWCGELVAADPCPLCGTRTHGVPPLDELTTGGAV
jgi:hypothetical protein